MFKRKPVFVLVGLIFLCGILCCSQLAFSQTIPAFKMRLTNGKMLSSATLSRQQPLIIIYFAPDCEHCQILMKEIFKKITDFKKALLVLVTFEPPAGLVPFEKQYKTFKYPNITVGTEVPVFFFRNYYRVEHTPFTALFDKHRKLIISYKDQTPVNDLIKRLKMLK